MSRDTQLDDKSKNLYIRSDETPLDDENSLHEQLKKIKEENEQKGDEKGSDNPVYEYCS